MALRELPVDPCLGHEIDVALIYIRVLVNNRDRINYRIVVELRFIVVHI